jgi:phage replication-related protein YjqB (UPF0714/DUF867 family)
MLLATRRLQTSTDWTVCSEETIVRRTLGIVNARGLALAITTISGCVGAGELAEERAVEGGAHALYAPAACTGREASPEIPLTLLDAEFRRSEAMEAEDHDSEHCWVGNGLTELVGMQVRVTANGRTGYCTVSDVHGINEEGVSGGGDHIVTLSPAGFTDKFNSSQSTLTGTMTTAGDDCGWVTTLNTTPDPAHATGVLGEFWQPPPGATFTAAFASPHGGNIEKLTDDQIAYIRNSFSGNFGLWSVVGDSQSRAHITSDDLSERSFFGLREIADGNPMMVAAFHGHAGGTDPGDCGDDVVVGGDVAAPFQFGVRRAIELAFDDRGISSPPSVRVAGAGDADPDCHGAASDDNFANFFSFGGDGLQLEQSLAMRNADESEVAGGGAARRSQAVAAAVARYVMAYTDPVKGSFAQAAWGHPTVGLRYTLYSNYGVRENGDWQYGRCNTEGDRGRVDYYRRRAGTSNDLIWVAGGEIECAMDNDYWGDLTFVRSSGFQRLNYRNTTGYAEYVFAVVVVRERSTNRPSVDLDGF